MKIVSLISKLFSIVCIFGGTIYVALTRYATVQEIEIKTTLGLVPTLFIGGIILVLFMFVSNGLKQSLRESKFGTLAILFFASTLMVILIGIWFVFNSMLISLQTSVDEYMLTMEYHKDTVMYMSIPIVTGMSVLAISELIKFDLVQKFIQKLIK
jgi:hypothetical protein